MKTRNIGLAAGSAFVLALLMGADMAVAHGGGQGSVGIYLNGDSVAFGYRDGYWDRNRSWHSWRNRDEAAWYRSRHRDRYYDYDHTRYRDRGWRGDHH